MIKFPKIYIDSIKAKLSSNRNNKNDSDKQKFYNFDIISYYHKFKINSAEDITVDDKTVADIDFYEVFKFLDYTKSKVGQQFFFNRLLTLDSRKDFVEQEKWITYFSQNKKDKIIIERILSKLDKHESYYITNLFLDEYIGKPKHYDILKFLCFLPAVFFLMTFISKIFYFLLGISIVLNLILHYRFKKYIYLYKDSVSQLLILINVVNEFINLGLFSNEATSLLKSKKSLEKLKKKMIVFRIEKIGDSDILEILFLIAEYIKIIFLIEPLVIFDVLSQLKSKKDDVRHLYEFIGEIDSYISILELRECVIYYCIPESKEKFKTLSFVDIYHPLIEDCVPNSLEINGKSILLTGSNMAGKTTFIRCVAINTLLAQTINTCFAREFKYCPMNILSAIRISDDLLNERSYYFEEVLTIKNMIAQNLEKGGNIFLLDEIFKGTNTLERISAGKAVLSYLAKEDSNVVFVSTHDVELADLLRDLYDLYHFTEIIQNDQISFDYKLKKGSLATRNAIRILEINDYPKEIINDAKETFSCLCQDS